MRPMVSVSFGLVSRYHVQHGLWKGSVLNGEDLYLFSEGESVEAEGGNCAQGDMATVLADLIVSGWGELEEEREMGG